MQCYQRLAEDIVRLYAQRTSTRDDVAMLMNKIQSTINNIDTTSNIMPQKEISGVTRVTVWPRSK